MRSHAKIPRGVAPWAAIVGFLLIGFLTPAEMARAQQAGKKPNILIIWGDDIGWYNVSAYNMGVMGYRTPNIDRIAREGAAFTDWTDDGHLAALRFGQWKLDFLEQRAHGFDVWQEKFDELRVPKLFTVRGDPFERADYESIGYDRWRIDHVFLLVPAQAYVASWLQSFREFPPRQRPASFSLDRVMESIAAFPWAN
jgi:arylsulfatase A-like enzyme